MARSVDLSITSEEYAAILHHDQTMVILPGRVDCKPGDILYLRARAGELRAIAASVEPRKLDEVTVDERLYGGYDQHQFLDQIRKARPEDNLESDSAAVTVIGLSEIERFSA